eukprot:gb/GECH01014286.1/.p1 GENE.gb/GECH01014286.1/~~gb/GECH01014286.1/.p1  ORF type:complete len:879 (+),score=213.90 gb/GECH01014286.1/:1-2637(+)
MSYFPYAGTRVRRTPRVSPQPNYYNVNATPYRQNHRTPTNQHSQTHYFQPVTNPSSRDRTVRTAASRVGARFYVGQPLYKNSTSSRPQPPPQPQHQYQHPQQRLYSTTPQANFIGQHPNNSPGANYSPFSVIVEFAREGECSNMLAVVRGTLPHMNSKWEVCNARGHSYVVNQSQVTFQLPNVNLNSLEELTLLEQKAKKIQSQISEQDVINTWERTTEQGYRRMNYLQAAGALFGRQQPEYVYAAYKLLMQHPLYFQPNPKHVSFSVVPKKQVESKKREMDKIRQQHIKEKKFLLRMCSKLKHSSNQEEEHKTLSTVSSKTIHDLEQNYQQTIHSEDLEWNPEQDAEFIEKLKDFALFKDKSLTKESTYGKFLFPLNVTAEPLEVYKLCVRLGILSKYDNFHTLTAEIPRGFPEWVESAASDIKKHPRLCPDIDQDIRKDYRHLDAFAIDQIDQTHEVDDAVGIETKQDGTEWIHVFVSDATRYVHFGSKMDEFAANRLTTVYHPDNVYFMMPHSLSVDILSLESGQDNCVLCFSMRLDDQGDIQEYDITPAIVNKVHRVDYDDLDYFFYNKYNNDSIPSDKQKTVSKDHLQILNRLMEIANQRTKLRLSRGASLIELPKPLINIQDGGSEISVKPSMGFMSYSRRLVAELMILAGEMSALFAAKNNIPVPFRGTRGRLQDTKLSELPSTIEQALVVNRDKSEEQIKNLVLSQTTKFQVVPSVYVDVDPIEHGALGIRGYAQVTSPIRRYADLLVHHQLKANIRGEQAPLQQDSMKKFISSSFEYLRKIKVLERQSEHFWVLHYFAQVAERNPNNLFKCLVYEVMDTLTSVYMFDVGYKSRVKLANNPTVGDTIWLRVLGADPLESTLNVRQMPDPN